MAMDAQWYLGWQSIDLVGKWCMLDLSRQLLDVARWPAASLFALRQLKQLGGQLHLIMV
jgi:hypothetical protein